ncbi:voltage-dependent T-type calcium channel subunit alpha-1G isoform X1 [Vespula squamosa]|uniref:Voltage-dependent T-type calcium channel subunit alpha-1G isoform X1 n=1 Tax=Vespula squamosa TaxID=30214 RepID=A0ABD2AAY2_VESSQ
MFSDVVLLHGSNSVGNTVQSGPTVAPTERNVCSSEKMTQTGDGNVWSSPLSDHAQMQVELGTNEAMTCQELLALSGALSAALPTGQLALDSFLNSLTKGITERHIILEDRAQWLSSDLENCSCCCDAQSGLDQWPENGERWRRSSRTRRFFRTIGNRCICGLRCIRRWIKKLVEHKYFQQGILLAILINTLSMGIEYHNQPEQLTVLVEISNIVFSAIFAVEMLLKVIAEGPFGYISNGFNVFDGIVVILSIVELCQSFVEERGGSSGLSVLRTFRLLRILKLVRFLPNLRRQLFVMLRTMDNVAVFFSLLVLFIFIFRPADCLGCSILGMYLFGGKFCMWADRSRPCTCAEVVSRHPMCRCDRKHFNDIVWALVTVFQVSPFKPPTIFFSFSSSSSSSSAPIILTQEDWNVVLFNGMQKTSHWAALYFVALMTFGNYVLFNLLVAILVEGFSSERNERREREQREMAKLAAKEAGMGSEEGSSRVSRSHSITDSDTYTQERKNSWQSAEELRKYKDNSCREKQNSSWRHRTDEPKCNIQKENKMMSGVGQPPIITHTAATPQDSPNTTLDVGYRDLNYRAVFPTAALSFESIDRTGSQCSIPSGLLKLPDNGGKFSTNNLIAGQFPRRISLVTAVVNPSSREFSNSRKSMVSEDMPVPCSTPRTINNLSMETGALPRIKPLPDQEDDHSRTDDQTPPSNGHGSASSVERIKKIFMFFEPKGCLKERDDYALYIFSPNNRFRALCRWFVDQKWFDNAVLFFIGLNCITLAMERPNIPSHSRERLFLMTANYIFTAVFAVEMFIKVVATGMLYGSDAYFTSGWNIMDGTLVTISIVDLMMSLISSSSPRIFGILRVFRLLRSLRPLRVINRAPGLKLVVQTLLSSLRPIGNIVLICCTFFVIFGILGVQLFKGAFYYCDGPDIKNVRNKTDCLADKRNVWLNRKYNFDDLGKALMSLFVLSSRDGWVNIMYTGLDAVGVDQQVSRSFDNPRPLYTSRSLIRTTDRCLNLVAADRELFGMAFAILYRVHPVGRILRPEHVRRRRRGKLSQMSRGTREGGTGEEGREEGSANGEKTTKFVQSKSSRSILFTLVSYFWRIKRRFVFFRDARATVLYELLENAALHSQRRNFQVFRFGDSCRNRLERRHDGHGVLHDAEGTHLRPQDIQLLFHRRFHPGVAHEVVGPWCTPLSEGQMEPIGRRDRYIISSRHRIGGSRVKDHTHQSDHHSRYASSSHSQSTETFKNGQRYTRPLGHGNAGVTASWQLGSALFLTLLYIRGPGSGTIWPISDETPCQGLGEHAHFSNFGMAFLTLFRVATGDNWNGIMKDTLRDDCDEATDCVKNCCMEDELDMETQLERELAAEREELLEVEEEEEEGGSLERHRNIGDDLDEDDEREFESMMGTSEKILVRPGLAKVRSLPANFIYNPPKEKSLDDTSGSVAIKVKERRRSSCFRSYPRPSKFKSKRRQTFHSSNQRRSLLPMHFEVTEVFEKPVCNLSVPRIIPRRIYAMETQEAIPPESQYLRVTSSNKENKSLLRASRPTTSSPPVTPSGSSSTLTTAAGGPRYQNERYLLPTAEIYPSKACFARRISTDAQSQSETSTSVAAGSCARTPSSASESAPSIRAKPEGEPDPFDANPFSNARVPVPRYLGATESARPSKEKEKQRAAQAEEEDLDVQSVINERRPSRLRSATSSGTSTTGTSDQCAQIVRVESFAHIYAAEELPDEPPDESSAFENVSETDTSGSINGSGTVSGSDGSRSISGLVQVVECTTCPAISTDVRIYVDDTDSISSSGHFGRTFAEDDDEDDDDETPDITMSISAPIDVVDEEAEEDNLEKTEDEPSLPGPSDPS